MIFSGSRPMGRINNAMNVIYVGALFPSRYLNIIKEKGSYVDFASYTFQTSIVAGLDYWYKDNLHLVSSIKVDSYPKTKQWYFAPEKYDHREIGGGQDTFTGLINLPIVKRFSKFLRQRKGIKELLSKTEKNVVVVYSLNSPNILAVASLKKHINKACIIVPDLPEFMSESKSKLYRFAKWFDKKLINLGLSYFDGFVLLSEHMKERLPIKNKQWRVMEGVYLPINEDWIVEKERNKTILYTGNLGQRTGIDNLLDAFALIEDMDYRLWIRGNGGMKSEVLKRASTDERIVYWEPMEKEDLLKLQRKATVLVNPIRASQEFTKYFFPSKTMEYMASGTPVVMYKLDCLPQDYFKHVFFVEDETVESLRDKLVEVCEMPKESLISFGHAASDYILKNKNSVAQAKIIVELLQNL